MQERAKERAELEQVEREKVEPITIYKNNIYALVDDVKQEPQFLNKSDEELKDNKAFFPVLVNYIYNSYIGELLGNKYGRQVVYKDIHQIDNLFNIYIDLVYKYKWNNKPFMVEFSIFTGINKDTIYGWLKGEYKGILENNNENGNGGRDVSRERSDIVRKWVATCEGALLNGASQDTIRDIFILKAKHNYSDRNNDINITVNHKQIVAAEDLPALISVDDSKN